MGFWFYACNTHAQNKYKYLDLLSTKEDFIFMRGLTECDIFVQCGLKVASKTVQHRVTTHWEPEALIPIVVHIWNQRGTVIHIQHLWHVQHENIFMTIAYLLWGVWTWSKLWAQPTGGSYGGVLHRASRNGTLGPCRVPDTLVLHCKV